MLSLKCTCQYKSGKQSCGIERIIVVRHHHNQKSMRQLSYKLYIKDFYLQMDIYLPIFVYSDVGRGATNGAPVKGSQKNIICAMRIDGASRSLDKCSKACSRRDSNYSNIEPCTHFKVLIPWIVTTLFFLGQVRFSDKLRLLCELDQLQLI